MKKLLFAAAILLSGLSIKPAVAQVSVSAGINIGVQPEWGPVGYDHADYYYMPDVDAYYDVPAHQYVYYNNNVWVHRAYLPASYHFDRYRTYKVVVNDRNPWLRHAEYRNRYASYRGRRDQVIIRNSRDVRYRNHWHDNGNHYGERNHFDRGRSHENRGHENRGHEERGHGNEHGGGEHGHGHDRH